MPRSQKRVWFFAVPGSDLLDVTGPWEVLRHANDVRLGDVSTMWRVFTQHLGVTPTEYRDRFAVQRDRHRFGIPRVPNCKMLVR